MGNCQECACQNFDFSLSEHKDTQVQGYEETDDSNEAPRRSHVYKTIAIKKKLPALIKGGGAEFSNDNNNNKIESKRQQLQKLLFDSFKDEMSRF